MSIENITLGELKKLSSLLGGGLAKSSITDQYIGQYVIIRSRNEGVNAGTHVKADSTGCVLQQARRLWTHKPKDPKAAWYEGVSISGLSDDSKVSAAVDSKAILEDYSITPCTDIAAQSIINHPSHECS